MFDYATRQRRLAERMEAENVDVLFLAPSADLEYLTGVERQIPHFGEAAYAHGWVAGAFFTRGAPPVFVLPRLERGDGGGIGGGLFAEVRRNSVARHQLRQHEDDERDSNGEQHERRQTSQHEPQKAEEGRGPRRDLGASATAAGAVVKGCRSYR